MGILILSVVTASLLGSLHCVGMCGPLAMWATGLGERGKAVAVPLGLYHGGRLITYALAGAVAGGLGQVANLGGEMIGLQTVAARIVGTVMVAIGLWKGLHALFPSWFRSNRIESMPPRKSTQPSWITMAIVRWRPIILSQPLHLRALMTGLLTAVLPCGWLYLFAFVAAGTGGPKSGMVVMLAFWVGTLPALVSLAVSAHLLSHRAKRAIPGLAALLLVIAGGYTAFGRGFADLGSLRSVRLNGVHPRAIADAGTPATSMTTQTIGENVQQLLETELPCCKCKTSQEP